jgi:hypothetical protein
MKETPLQEKRIKSNEVKQREIEIREKPRHR